MKLFLVVASGRHKGMPIAIKADLFVMGSDPVCQLRSHLPGIGRQHFALARRGHKTSVRDLNSGQPTFVNGELVPAGEDWSLHRGDCLTVGPLEFLIQFREHELWHRDLEEWALRCLDERDHQDGEGFFEEEDEALRSFLPPPRPTTAAAAAGAILDKLQDRRGIVMGHLRIGKEADVTTVRFNDAHLVEEAELALIKKELFTQCTRPNLRILLDFKNVQRMSGMAADMILELYRQVRAQGSSIALCRLRPQLHPALETRSVLRYLRHFPDKHVALVARW